MMTPQTSQGRSCVAVVGPHYCQDSRLAACCTLDSREALQTHNRGKFVSGTQRMSTRSIAHPVSEDSETPEDKKTSTAGEWGALSQKRVLSLPVRLGSEEEVRHQEEAGVLMSGADSELSAAASRLRGKRLLLNRFQSQLLTLDCSPPFRTPIHLSDFVRQNHSLNTSNWASNALPLRRLRDRDLRGHHRLLSDAPTRSCPPRHVPSRC